MRKIAIAIAAGILVVIGITSVVLNIKKDDVAPVISVEATNMKYSVGCEDKVLLQGAKALDKVDGDVSDTLEIVGRTVITEDELEVVEYAACDKSGNVCSQKMVFVMTDKENFQVCDYESYSVDLDNLECKVDDSKYEGYLSASTQVQEEKIVDDKTSNKETSKSEDNAKESVVEGTKEPDDDTESTVEPTAELTKEPTKEPTKKPTKEPTKEPTKKPTKEPTKEPTQQPTDGKPTIVLKTNDITVRRGSSTTVYLNCIKQIKDDKDSSEQLFRKVCMTRALSLRVAGTYTQGLYCVDSDGNRSNVATITVHVR